MLVSMKRFQSDESFPNSMFAEFVLKLLESMVRSKKVAYFQALLINHVVFYFLN